MQADSAVAAAGSVPNEKKRLPTSLGTVSNRFCYALVFPCLQSSFKGHPSHLGPLAMQVSLPN